jgi:hypothetical protein
MRSGTLLPVSAALTRELHEYERPPSRHLGEPKWGAISEPSRARQSR